MLRIEGGTFERMSTSICVRVQKQVYSSQVVRNCRHLGLGTRVAQCSRVTLLYIRVIARIIHRKSPHVDTSWLGVVMEI